MINVVQLPARDIRDIPRMLREIADDMEAGHFDDPTAVVVIVEKEDEYPHVFGLGADALPPRCVWLMELAKAFFAANHAHRCG